MTIVRKVIIHVGHSKTGTTSLQRFFARNYDRLLERDILYPRAGRVDDGHHHLFPLGDEVGESLIQELLSEVKTIRMPNILVSSEYAYYSIDSIKKILNALDMPAKVIFYARPQIEALLSNFLHRQRMNLPYQKTLEGFYRTHRNSFDYKSRIDEVSAVCGDEKPIIRLYISGRSKEHVISDFLAALELNDMCDLPMSDTSNLSMHPCFSSLISLLDQGGSIMACRDEIIKIVMAESAWLHSKSSQHPILDRQLAREIGDFYYKSNVDFMEKYISVEDKKAFSFAFLDQLSNYKFS